MLIEMVSSSFYLMPCESRWKQMYWPNSHVGCCNSFESNTYLKPQLHGCTAMEVKCEPRTPLKRKPQKKNLLSVFPIFWSVRRIVQTLDKRNVTCQSVGLRYLFHLRPSLLPCSLLPPFDHLAQPQRHCDAECKLHAWQPRRERTPSEGPACSRLRARTPRPPSLRWPSNPNYSSPLPSEAGRHLPKWTLTRKR